MEGAGRAGETLPARSAAAHAPALSDTAPLHSRLRVFRKLPATPASLTLRPVPLLSPAMPDSPDLDSIRERQHPRVAANLPVEVKAPGMLRQAVAEDISLAGLRVLGLRAPVGQSLLVALALPGDRRGGRAGARVGP